ncbi:hypothetical protein ACOJBO_02610 [Rhizobium beringeri]
MGALLAAPFVIVIGAIELSLGFVGRSAKQFPLNDSVATFKNPGGGRRAGALRHVRRQLFQRDLDAGFCRGEIDLRGRRCPK